MTGMNQKEMVAAVSAVMGVPIETVTVMDRYLAEAGLRTRALRGRGRTEMAPIDMAYLLIAAAINGPLKDTAAISSSRLQDATDIADIISSRSSSSVSISLKRGEGCAVSVEITPIAAIQHFEARS